LPKLATPSPSSRWFRKAAGETSIG
jgi:hypothetical protein